MKANSILAFLSWPLPAVMLALTCSGDVMAKNSTAKHVHSKHVYSKYRPSKHAHSRHVTATDVECKRACIDVDEIADGAISAAKLNASMLAGETQSATVNCPGDSIQDAIDDSTPGNRLVITVNGTCQENVLIRRDLTTLESGIDGVIEGVPASAGNESFESPLNVAGADVVLQGITVNAGTNENFGILISDGGNVWAENVTVSDSQREGILVVENSNLDLVTSTVQGSGASGVLAADNSHIDLVGSTISGGAIDGLVVIRGSSAKLDDSNIDADGEFSCAVFVGEQSVLRMNSGNTLTNDSLSWNCATLSVYRNSSARIQGTGNSISNSSPVTGGANAGAAGGFALDVEAVSSLRIDGSEHATISGNVYSFNLSSIDLRKAVVNGGVYSDGLSANVRLRGNFADDVIVNGDVFPATEVNIRNAGEVVINGNIDCSNGSWVRADFAHFGAGGGYVNCPWSP